jgi:hypothetical protein
MKLIIIILFSLMASSSYASFNRLWIGFKKKDVETALFLNGLNKTFFKDTIEVGKGRGLISYQPYVTNMNDGIPDELALVIYESEEKYRQIRSTPAGERYSALHWDFFEKEISKSTVSKPFSGVLEDGQAYELIPQFANWQKGFTHVAIYSRSTLANDNLILAFENLRQDNEVNNSIILVTTKWIIEYRSLKKISSTYRKLPLKLLEHKQLSNEKLNSHTSTVGFGQGINFNFDVI